MADLEEVPEKVPRLGLRHLQAGLLFYGLAANTVLQLNVSVAVVAMTNGTSSNDSDPPVALQLVGGKEVVHPVELLLGLRSGPIPCGLSVQALRLQGGPLLGHSGIIPAQCPYNLRGLCSRLEGVLRGSTAAGSLPGDMALHPPAPG
ncbi:uncharacterized protein LOC119560340 isoform X3 [Drosophila subpulchrella]|uniref:uncharacterized protein LOC119560340 isoform X3 n=1 Tax=Drosophila subpulchrella TaxID=1486046 RepID=UPI0018A13289|nr:uncharacterized protein LOC119560340 isoform X3 [Drosophila subpulchrella]